VLAWFDSIEFGRESIIDIHACVMRRLFWVCSARVGEILARVVLGSRRQSAEESPHLYVWFVAIHAPFSTRDARQNPTGFGMFYNQGNRYYEYRARKQVPRRKRSAG
jgi:hypothetical protein